MKPKFKTHSAWEQAQLLMQPAFIRVVDNFRDQLEDSDWEGEYEEIQDPYPGYVLHLKCEEAEHDINLWDLCYQVCFVQYPSESVNGESCEVDIDTNLFEASGAVDWQKLENKTQMLIKQIFATLPEAK
ncbi:hypothetical protein Lepto7376_2760 [[Leptolyngbya] sp. PCC 7376]|uniref:hypothetical protein n=1 Tax=[Leptolyngbya] sp. PCC 7376 TaxID=111781 RepID=UPI00029EF863|nr:hypothetical protein [[Leptolyngbya] sp. PCC 7376]AFY39020.1 hypothetical protein Lepto7376_2760 [[Leptolyngbya] sp. PCC 7376]